MLRLLTALCCVCLVALCRSIRPCGTIVDIGLCPAQFCQGLIPVSYYNASWTPADEQASTGSNSLAIWSTVFHGGQQGVAQIIQDGAPCNLKYGDYDYYEDARQGAIYFLCNETATEPFLQSVTEGPTCHYTALVQTAAACGVSTADAHQPGLSVLSTQCGGGIYSLSSLSADITGSNLAGNNWTVNLCGPITSVAACAGWSTCQWGATYANVLTNYSTQYPIVYTFTQQGVEQIIQDGRANCYGTNTQRFTNVSLICDTTATTPVMVDVVEVSYAPRLTQPARCRSCSIDSPFCRSDAHACQGIRVPLFPHDQDVRSVRQPAVGCRVVVLGRRRAGAGVFL